MEHKIKPGMLYKVIQNKTIEACDHKFPAHPVEQYPEQLVLVFSDRTKLLAYLVDGHLKYKFIDKINESVLEA